MVPGLKRGKTAARETAPVKPVDDKLADATLAYLSEVLADMVRVQRFTGCRPAEVCMMRPRDIDRSQQNQFFSDGNIGLGRITNGNNYLAAGISSLQSPILLHEVLPGDFNSNAAVDAADYVTWRDASGPLAPFLASYGAWRTNFGTTMGSASQTQIAIPEQTALAMSITGVGLLTLGRRRASQVNSPAEVASRRAGLAEFSACHLADLD